MQIHFVGIARNTRALGVGVTYNANKQYAKVLRRSNSNSFVHQLITTFNSNHLDPSYGRCRIHILCKYEDVLFESFCMDFSFNYPSQFACFFTLCM